MMGAKQEMGFPGNTTLITVCVVAFNIIVHDDSHYGSTD
jgi:hypothetical protein